MIGIRRREEIDLREICVKKRKKKTGLDPISIVVKDKILQSSVDMHINILSNHNMWSSNENRFFLFPVNKYKWLKVISSS